MRVNRKNDLSLKLFEVFGAVIVHQTTVDAAIDLGISQPAVSIAIKKLENDINGYDYNYIHDYNYIMIIA